MKTEKQKQYLQKLLCYTSKELFTAVLIATMVILIPSKVNAQFKQGVKLMAGASCQSEVLHLYDNGDMKFAYGAGWIGEYRFNKGFGLQTGLEYLEKGKSRKENGIRTSYKFNYLEVPLLAKYTAGEKAGFKNDIQFYAVAGPYISYLLSAKRHENNNSVSISDLANNVDAGIRFGFGFEFPFSGASRLRLGLNYDMGLTNVYHSESEIQNKLATVNVGLLF